MDASALACRANADVKWTLMVVIGSYTGFILLGGGILSIYTYLYYDYLFGDLYKDLPYKNLTQTIGERWDDQNCASKLIVLHTLSLILPLCILD